MIRISSVIILSIICLGCLDSRENIKYSDIGLPSNEEMYEKVKECKSSYELNHEKDICIKPYIYKINNPSLCNELHQEDVSCLWKIAIRNKNQSFCELVRPNRFPYDKDDCYFEYGINLKNKTACEKIQDNNHKIQCIATTL